MNAKTEGQKAPTDSHESDEIMTDDHLNGDDLIYHSDIGLDTSLKSFAEILKVPRFSVFGRVKIYVPSTKSFESCFEFMPSEVPIEERVMREYGPGAYEVWVYNKGKIYKRLKLNISPDAVVPQHTRNRTDRAPGARVSPFVDEGNDNSGVSNDKAVLGQIGALRREIDQLRTAGRQNRQSEQAAAGTGIDYTEIIKAEERGYRRAKEFFDLQLSSVKSHHETQLSMIKESKGNESYLEDDEGELDPESFIANIAAIVAPAVEALSPFAEAYLTQKETESMLARVGAGLPPEPEMEPAEEVKAGGEAKGDEAKGGEEDQPVEVPENIEEVVKNMFITLIGGAMSNQNPVDHAEGMTSKFKPDFLKALFLKPGALDALFVQRPDLVGNRPWFEAFLSSLKQVLDGGDGKNTTEKSDKKTVEQKEVGGKSEDRTDAGKNAEGGKGEAKNTGDNKA